MKCSRQSHSRGSSGGRPAAGTWFARATRFVSTRRRRRRQNQKFRTLVPATGASPWFMAMRRQGERARWVGARGHGRDSVAQALSPIPSTSTTRRAPRTSTNIDDKRTATANDRPPAHTKALCTPAPTRPATIDKMPGGDSATRSQRKGRPEALSLQPSVNVGKSSSSTKGPRTPRTPKTPTNGSSSPGPVRQFRRQSTSATDLMVDYYANTVSPGTPRSAFQLPDQVPPLPGTKVAADGEAADGTVNVEEEQRGSQSVDAWSIPDVSIAECNRVGVNRLLVSRIPMCYFLGHFLDQFAPENLFFMLDVLVFHTHPAVVFDTYLAGSAPLELNLPDTLRMQALNSWAMSDPVECFETVRAGVMTMLDSYWIAYKKSSIWRNLVAQHPEGDDEGEPGYTVADLHAAITHLVTQLNNRYPAGGPVNGGSPSRGMRRMGLDGSGPGSRRGSQDDGEVGPHALIRQKTCDFINFCCDGEIPEEVLLQMYPGALGKKHRKANKKGSSSNHGSDSESHTSGPSGILRFFGLGKKHK
ncbi:hypothetical protein AMAG_03549 [Allomyces macrogynus ATCC 38327]|uniref:RGS domain-containing protein n=1 Tax=Allomyces macrogynus (strain ATCC 38327) TaxID=578462 RepID=A0A0L0S9U6_ALLM3|nr:hypothetical protein AMAG_03549 [Allomyces macrogynus ATCC 38327]|eukprot:KNE59231.1 hypothetical protein AMAG_03549 [Allomyces macrogynus ATCC 38327]